jgi:hypothetical protein
MQVTMVDPRQGRRLASFVATGSAVAAVNRREAVIDAFERATAAAMSAAVDGVRQSAPGAPH